LSQDVLNASYPWDYELRGWSQCMSRDIINFANGTIIGKAIDNVTKEESISNCKQYVYDRSVYKSTTTSEV